jgi:hypothetical protein
MSDPRAAPRRFELVVHVESERSRWRATVCMAAAGTVVEFDHPLELLRWLARLTLAERGGGLR